jgi:hypothetical protein
MRLGVAVLTSMMIVVSAGLLAVAEAGELRSSYDGGPQVSALESRNCAEQRLDLARPGADRAGEEQFAADLSGVDDLRQQFIQADEDGDRRISRDEWLRWFGPAVADKADGPPSGPN